uniref:EF-hand domain-containing protein n=1 Tax=Steinernema glaseri TaxID=37863 RepID=A0A1I7ZNV4_9BILA
MDIRKYSIVECGDGDTRIAWTEPCKPFVYCLRLPLQNKLQMTCLLSTSTSAEETANDLSTVYVYPAEQTANHLSTVYVYPAEQACPCPLTLFGVFPESVDLANHETSARKMSSGNLLTHRASLPRQVPEDKVISPITRQYRQVELEAQELFRMIEPASIDNCISKEKVPDVLRCLVQPLKPTEEEFKKVIDGMQYPAGHRYNTTDMVILKRHLEKSVQVAEDEMEEMQYVLKVFSDDPNLETISPARMGQILTSMGETMSEEEVATLQRVLPKDHDNLFNIGAVVSTMLDSEL